MNLDEIRKLFEHEKVVDLMKKCNVESVSAFGPDISGHSFNPSARINLLLKGKDMGLLEFSEFKRKLPSLIKRFDVQIYTEEALKRLTEKNLLPPEYHTNVMAHAQVVTYSPEAEIKPEARSINTDDIEQNFNLFIKQLEISPNSEETIQHLNMALQTAIKSMETDPQNRIILAVEEFSQVLLNQNLIRKRLC
jgi:hypothetical protein